MPLAGLGGASKTQLPLYTLFLLEILPKLAATLIFSGDLHEYFYASSLALVSFVEELYAPMSGSACWFPEKVLFISGTVRLCRLSAGTGFLGR
jgi:hypothetical protein